MIKKMYVEEICEQIYFMDASVIRENGKGRRFISLIDCDDLSLEYALEDFVQGVEWGTNNPIFEKVGEDELIVLEGDGAILKDMRKVIHTISEEELVDLLELAREIF
jgi:hypothetical protein